MNIFKKIFYPLITFMVCIPLCLQGINGEHLHKKDINSVMGQIFERHIEKKEMTGSILQESLKHYIEQFDPSGIYLLESEVAPYLDPSSGELKKYMAQYRNQNYAPFEELDALFQKGIKRADAIRAELEKKPDSLFEENLTIGDFDFSGRSPYPKDLEELKSRIRMDLLAFIQYQKERFGEEAVKNRKNYVFQMYNNDKDAWEESYTYKDMKGHALPLKDQEHLFTLHVLKALAKSLDSHTAFLSDGEAEDMKMRLQKGYYGTGITFERGINGITISKIFKDSPAGKSKKISEGDILVELNGKNIENEPFREVMKAFHGDKGEGVELAFRNEKGKKYSVYLVRDLILLADDRVGVESIPFEDGIIGKLTLNSFYQGENGVSSEEDIIKGLKELREEGKLKALILDLRDNSGGYLSQAVKVAGLFITNGVVVISKYDDGSRNIYRDVDGKTYFDGPIIVLISRLTASAAEIVAQALQDYGVAVVVGDDRSFGKGSIQNQTVTSGEENSFFKVTVGKYYTVSGKTPQKVGVASDILVPSSYVNENIGEIYNDGALDNDKIAPEFKDRLQDVSLASKGWYLHYYLPTLQPRETTWKKILPELKARSTQRLLASGVLSKGSVTPDEQVDEAYKIAKDMIQLHSKFNPDHIGSY